MGIITVVMNRCPTISLSACLYCYLLALSPTLIAQQLPQFSIGTSLSGDGSSARFHGGISKDGGQTLDTKFASEDSLDIFVEFQLAPEHVGSEGSLYVAVAVNGDFFIRTADGSYQPWNENIESLQATVVDKPLQATESLTILQGVKFGPLGLPDADLSIYLAYNISTKPTQFYYSSTPLRFSISNVNTVYDPSISIGVALEQLDTTAFDINRNREIPVLIYLPESPHPSPVILFSHGLAGNRFSARYLGEHWSDRGYSVVFLQHPGSDESILDGLAPSNLLAAMNDAASLENAIARIADVSAVLDRLEQWNLDSSHVLYNRLNMELIGMSGHSFGARTSQAVSGQNIITISGETRDHRIKAATIFSPSIPDFGTTPNTFGQVSIPWLLMTGTEDVAIVGNTSVEDRLAVYPLLPPGNKYELVLFEGKHHAFTDRALSSIQSPRNPAHHGEIAAISTAFWDAWLLNDDAAQDWLEGPAIQSVLQAGDTWQFK